MFKIYSECKNIQKYMILKLRLQWEDNNAKKYLFTKKM